VAGLLSVWLLAGCSAFDALSGDDYRKSDSLPPLEVPPDLTTPDWSQRMSVPGETPTRASTEAAPHDQGPQSQGAQQAVVAPQFKDLKVRRDGNVRWLQVQASPEALWPRLQQFWREQEIPVLKEDPTLGFMETDWYDSPSGLPRTGLKGALSRVSRFFGGPGVRNRYRLRLERDSDHTTDIYITVQHAEQVGDEFNDEQTPGWQLLPADPELEAEILAKLMVFLGTAKELAEREVATVRNLQPNMELARRDGQPTLIVKDAFSKVWRVTGVALDRAGLYVEQQDRDKGTYYFTYTDDQTKRPSLLQSLFGGSDLEVDKRYEVHLSQEGEKTLISAHNSGEDKAPLEAEAAETLLKRLMAAYRTSG
jgi:outer membrane protein assembly factor BamC